MPLSRQRREEIRSAAITQTPLLVLACSLIFGLTAFAADPSWWTNSGTGSQPAVMAEQRVTNNGVVSTNYIPNPNAVVTQGQLKQFTARAVDEFNTELPGGAGPALSNLVYGWHQDYATNNYAGTNNPYAPHKPSDLNAMTVGQLKYIGNTVYGRLSAAGYTNLAPSWLARNTNSDNSVAVLGQLKEVFDFDFSLPSASNFTATSGASGTVNLSWSASTNNVAPWVVEEQVPDGSWTFLTTLPSTAESYAVTGLTSGQGYTFQVFANGTNNVSAIASASTLLTSFPSSGLAVWLKADVGLSQSGGVVTGWTDQSLSHNDASPSSVPPTVTTDSNGFHVVHFDGSGNNFLTIADNPTVDPNTFTILVAAKDYGPDNSQYIICRPYRSTGDFGGWTSPYMSYAAKLSESSTTFQGGDVTPVGSSYIENGNANTYDPNQVHDFSWRYDGTNQEAYTAGILTTSTPTSGNIDYSGGSANMTIGTHSSTDLRPPNDEALNADVYEILIYNRALTDTELQEAQEYLADKYKLYDVSATWPLAYSSDVQALIATYQWTKSEADAYLASEAAYPNISSDGLVLHLDSSAGVTTNSSGQVSAWQDQSPWGHSAAQTTEANQPQLITDPATSLPGLQFSGNQYLSSPDTIPANQDLTIISVAEADNTANFTLLGGLGLSSAAGTLRDAGYRANQPEFDTLDNYAQAGNAPPAGVSAVATTTFSYSTGGVNFYVSGSLAGQGTTASSVVANGFTIGSAGWVGNFWTGKISEILVYDRVLSSAEQQAAEVYLADKYKVYHPDATWPLAYSSEVQAEIATNHWTKAQADAYVALQQNTSGVPTAGLHLWLEADAGVTADGGGNVSSWTDQTGNFTVTQNSSGSEPTYVTNDINGLPAVRFSGSQWLSNPNPALGINGAMTMIAVCSSTSANNQQYSVWYGTNEGAASSVCRAIGYDKSNELFDGNFNGVLGADAPLSGAFIAEGVSLDSGLDTATFYQNEVQTAQAPLANLQNINAGVTIGAQDTAGGNGCGWQGDIAEVLVYDHQLSPTELQQVGAYLQNKYGLPYTQSTPVIIPNGGNFTSAQTVTITTSQSGATIHYTIDGTTPTINSPTYTGSFTLGASALVQAVAYSTTGLPLSQVGSAQFYINDPDQTGLPAAPTGLNVTAASATDINLSWTLGTQLTYSQVDVYRSTNGGAYQLIAVLGPTATSFSDTTVTPGNSYTYQIGTANQAGVAETSASSSVTSNTPTPLTIQITTPSGAVPLP